MALINCPECGKNISSLAEKCVQCGATIHVCKECETVWAGEKTNCPECGYAVDLNSEEVVKKTISDSNQKSSNQAYQTYMGITNNPFQNMNNENMLYSMYKSIPLGKRFVANIFTHMSWMVLVLMGVILLIWSSSLELVLTRTDEIAALCRGLVVISFGLLVIGKTYGRYKRSILTNNHFVSYLATNNVDLTNEVRKSYSFNWLGLTQKEKYTRVVNIDYLIRMAIQFEDSSYKIYPDTNKKTSLHRRTLTALCMDGICSACGNLVFYALLFGAVEEVFMKGLLEGFDVVLKDALQLFSSNLYILIIGCCLVPIVAAVIAFMVISIVEKNNFSLLKTWVEKNIPDQKENFEKYNISNTTPFGTTPNQKNS